MTDTTTLPQVNSPTATEASSSQSAQDYSRLSLEVENRYPRLKPGESATMTVTVQNHDDKEITLTPAIKFPPRAEGLLPTEWVTIATDDPTLDPDEETTFNATINVPADAELGRYHGLLAVTDEQVPYPGRPPRPMHAANLGVNVYKEPTVYIRSETYLNGQVQAGDTATAEIVVENTGDEPVPVNPDIQTNNRHHRPASQGLLDAAWLSIDAPSEIAPGEKETVEVTVSPPTDANRGHYRTEFNLGIKDPTRPEEDQHWQQLSMSVNVWSDPDEPFARTVSVRNGTESMTLRLTQNARYGSNAFNQNPTPGSFNVTFVSPDGTELFPERDQATTRGSVDLTRNQRAQPSDDGYTDQSRNREFEYDIENPTPGDWRIEIMPKNTIRFGYELIRTE